VDPFNRAAIEMKALAAFAVVGMIAGCTAVNPSPEKADAAGAPAATHQSMPVKASGPSFDSGFVINPQNPSLDPKFAVKKPEPSVDPGFALSAGNAIATACEKISPHGLKKDLRSERFRF
jgi:hypothetical protein